jgi:PHD/YefM family antitoxin component YafN of YafNO toxin-antitoxin module
MLNLKEIEFQYVTNQAGEKTAVLLPIGEFQELMEDIEALAAIAERREEPTILHSELLTELKRNEII